MFVCFRERVCVSLKREKARVLGNYQTHEHRKKSPGEEVHTVSLSTVCLLSALRDTLKNSAHTNTHTHTNNIGPHVIVKSHVPSQHSRKEIKNKKTPQW